MFKKISHWFKRPEALDGRKEVFNVFVEASEGEVEALKDIVGSGCSCAESVSETIKIIEGRIIPAMEVFAEASKIDTEVARPANRVEFEGALTSLIRAELALRDLECLGVDINDHTYTIIRSEVDKANAKIRAMLFSYEMTGDEYIESFIRGNLTGK